MVEDKKPVALYMPEKTWWLLRKKLAQSMPKSKVNASLLESLLNIESGPAKDAYRTLRALGILDENERLTERANRLRSDEDYPQVCREILAEVYPPQMHDLFPSADTTDVTQLRNWFMKTFGVGAESARQRAAFYMILLKGDPNDAASTVIRTTPTKQNDSGRTRPAPGVRKAQENLTPAQEKSMTATAQLPERATKGGMSLHVDIQIHISPETTLDQIDKIFESMAKHLHLGK